MPTSYTSKISHSKVHELLSYDPDTGHLTWKTGKHSKRVVKGRRAGYERKSGYRGITLLGKTYSEHHIIWFMQTGLWASEIVHINHNKSDNSWNNLREVSHAENNLNLKQRSDNNTGLQGIYYDHKTDRYISHITIKGKKVFQKSYTESQLTQAIQERKDKLIELGFHINHGT